jgi:hypothetical protein
VAEGLGTWNAVHAFREGNGRTQREFVRELAYKNSYWIDWNKVSREELYVASDASFMRVDNTLFEKLLKGAIEPIDRDRFPPPGARSRSRNRRRGFNLAFGRNEKPDSQSSRSLAPRSRPG